jgi:phthiocerol/phenolphthiocerol synthesis type-I polyketide synthase C
MAHWMVDRDARNIVFLSRSGAQKEEAQKLVKELAAEGARIAVYACDLSDEDRLREVLEEVARDLPPIRGVIQSAMVIAVCLTRPYYIPLSEITDPIHFRTPRLRVLPLKYCQRH